MDVIGDKCMCALLGLPLGNTWKRKHYSHAPCLEMLSVSQVNIHRLLISCHTSAAVLTADFDLAMSPCEVTEHNNPSSSPGLRGGTEDGLGLWCTRPYASCTRPLLLLKHRKIYQGKPMWHYIQSNELNNKAYWQGRLDVDLYHHHDSMSSNSHMLSKARRVTLNTSVSVSLTSAFYLVCQFSLKVNLSNDLKDSMSTTLMWWNLLDQKVVQENHPRGAWWTFPCEIFPNSFFFIASLCHWHHKIPQGSQSVVICDSF